eukprot:359606_1
MSNKKKRSINEILDNESNFNNNPAAKKARLNEENDLKNTEINGLDENDENDNVMIKNKLLSSGEPIMLNIGGIKYSTSLITLSSDTNSILYKMFDEKWSLKPNNDGSYFIDRNGENFKYILDFLRTHKLNIPDNIYLINHLILEAEYYYLSSLKRSLLLKKSGSKILKERDMEFVQKCFHDEYPQDVIQIQKSALIHRGSMWPNYDKLKGLDRLLFLIQSKTNAYTFGIFVEAKYVAGDPGKVGFVFDLCSNISGECCHHKKYKYNGESIYIDEISDNDHIDTEYWPLPINRILDATIIIQDPIGDILECIINKVDNEWLEYRCAWTATDQTMCREEIRQIEIYHLA